MRRILPRRTSFPLVTLVSLFFSLSLARLNPFSFLHRGAYTLLQKRTSGQCTCVPSVSDGTYTTTSGEFPANPEKYSTIFKLVPEHAGAFKRAPCSQQVGISENRPRPGRVHQTLDDACDRCCRIKTLESGGRSVSDYVTHDLLSWLWSVPQHPMNQCSCNAFFLLIRRYSPTIISLTIIFSYLTLLNFVNLNFLDVSI